MANFIFIIKQTDKTKYFIIFCLLLSWTAKVENKCRVSLYPELKIHVLVYDKQIIFDIQFGMR